MEVYKALNRSDGRFYVRGSKFSENVHIFTTKSSCSAIVNKYNNYNKLYNFNYDMVVVSYDLIEKVTKNG